MKYNWCVFLSCFIFMGAFASKGFKQEWRLYCQENQNYLNKLESLRGAIDKEYSKEDVQARLDVFKTFLRASKDRFYKRMLND